MSGPLFDDKVTSHRLLHLLRHRHRAPEWASWAELSDGTGAHKKRQIDLFAMALWPSLDYRGIAYEVKVSRADFRRELDDPTKRAPWEKLAHETWFAAPKGVIPPGEVPEGWGLLELDGDVLAPKVRALQRAPEPWPTWFMAAIARRCDQPPRDVPVHAWRVAGRVLDLDQVMALAEAVIRHRGPQLEQRRRALATLDGETERQRAHEQQRRDELRRLGAIANMVRRLTGAWNAEGLLAWFGTAGRETPGANEPLVTAYRILGEFLESRGVKTRPRIPGLDDVG